MASPTGSSYQTRVGASGTGTTRRVTRTEGGLAVREVTDVAAQCSDDRGHVAQVAGAEIDAVAHVADGLRTPASELATRRQDGRQRCAAVGGVGVTADEALLLELVDELGD